MIDVRPLARHRAVRGVAAIAGGTGVGQLVVLLAAPVLSRLYSPEVFGPFAVVNATVLPLSVVLALRLDMAVPIPKDDREAADLVALGTATALALAAVAEVVLLLTRKAVAAMLGLSVASSSLLLWAPVVAALMAVFTMLSQAAIRERQYAAIARRNVLQNVAVTGLQIVGGVLAMGSHGLAGGLALGQLVGVLSLARGLRGGAGGRVSAARARGLLRRYRTMPLVLMPSGLVNSVGIQAPVMLVATLYGAHVAGWLGMTQRVLLMPIALVGLAVAQVFLGEFGAAYRAGAKDLERRFLLASGALAACGAVLALVLLALGPTVFPVVLGEQWRQSGEFARALALGVAAQMVASPLSQTLVVLGRQVQQALWDLGRLVLVVGAVWSGHVGGFSVVDTMWLLGGATAVSYAAAWLLSWLAVRSTSSIAGRASWLPRIPRARGLS